MASEISYSVNLTVSKAGVGSVSGSASLTKDMAGSDMEALTAATSTSITALPVGALAQLQSILIKNNDATNSVKIGLDNAMAQRFATIKPGGAIILEQPPTVLYTQATAGTPSIFIVACED